MYEKPTLERFGTFRELTLLGTPATAGDIAVVFAPQCNPNSNRPEFQCRDGS